jgi:ketosteroid isomerase-like protein
LEQREEALENRDLDRYLGCISPDYQDSRGQDFSRLKQRFEEVSGAFDNLDFIPGRRIVYQDGVTATVIQDFVLRFQPQGGDAFSRKGRERIVLRKEKGSWEIIDGL